MVLCTTVNNTECGNCIQVPVIIDIEGPSISEEVESRSQGLRSASTFFVHEGTLECFPLQALKLDVYFLSLYLFFLLVFCG